MHQISSEVADYTIT